MKESPRVTHAKTILRKTSIYKLPELFNAIRGETSAVKPRPFPVRDVTRFHESWLLMRFGVRPGITILWKMRGKTHLFRHLDPPGPGIRRSADFMDRFSHSLKTSPAGLYGRGCKTRRVPYLRAPL
jgi:lipopolysaccharide/colanic/teichoic acid biosynthesis glycosyltransferase